jgi:hypothetical protein
MEKGAEESALFINDLLGIGLPCTHAVHARNDDR